MKQGWMDGLDITLMRERERERERGRRGTVGVRERDKNGREDQEMVRS